MVVGLGLHTTLRMAAQDGRGRGRGRGRGKGRGRGRGRGGEGEEGREVKQYGVCLDERMYSNCGPHTHTHTRARAHTLSDP